MTGTSWQLVLYGRTARADRWWRVLPRTADIDWLNDVVTTTTAGGEGLDAGPRFVLARHRGQTLVGGVSRAALLSDTMNSDGSRPFYTFVGWFSEDHEVAILDLDILEGRWSTWAGEEYNAWMPLDWNRHQSDLGRAHEPPIRRPPWTDQDVAAHPGPRPPGLPQESTPHLDDSPSDVAAPPERYVRWRHTADAVGDVQLVVGPATVGSAQPEDGLPQPLAEPSTREQSRHPDSTDALPVDPEAAVYSTDPPADRGQSTPPTKGAAESRPAWTSPPAAPSPAGAAGPRPNRLQRKFKQFITGIDEDAVADPQTGARIPMAKDLEYLRLQEQQKSAKHPPAKDVGPPPDTRSR